MKRILFIVALALPLIGGFSLAADFNGDGTGDIAVFRLSSGLWAVRGITRLYFGRSGDDPIPGDYDGSGTDSPAIFRDASGLWSVQGVTRVYFGSSGDEAKPGDYDGDGTYDIGIFRRGSGLWAIKGVTRIYFGSSGDVAIAAGKAGVTPCGLPPTGQTAEYRSGDDGTYQAGAPFRHELLNYASDWVTVDHKTGLMWTHDGDLYGCNWGQQTDWDAAIDWCNNMVFAGYDDWRLPNVKELQSIVDYGSYDPAIDITYFINTKSGYYCSSSTFNSNTSYAWNVGFNTGNIVQYGGKTNKNYIRAVRGGE